MHKKLRFSYIIKELHVHEIGVENPSSVETNFSLDRDSSSF